MPSHDPAGDRALVGVIAVLLAAWAWLCSNHSFVHVGDEAIYLYDGWLVSQGHLPYRDFFLAHPPLRVLFSAGLFALGLPAVAGKWLAIAATGGNTVLIATLARRISGPWAGIAAAMLWMGGALSLETGSYYLGSNIATTFMLAACLAAAYDRFAWAGAILGIGAHQALYTVLPGPVLLWWAWRQGKTTRFVLGGMTWPAGMLLAWLAFGDAYWAQTVSYHLRKVNSTPKPWPVHRILGFLRGDWTAVTLALAAWLNGGQRTRFLAALAWQTLAVVCLYRSLQGYYFILPLALLCAAGGAGAVQLGRLLRARIQGTPGEGSDASVDTAAKDDEVETIPQHDQEARPPNGFSPGRASWAAAAALVVVWLLSAIPNLHATISRRAFLPVVDAELSQLTRMVKAKAPRSGLLWGDTSVTPALALRTGLPIAANFVDTNDQRFQSGLSTPQQVNDAVLTKHQPGVLMIAHHGVYRVAGVRQHVEQRWVAQFIFQGRAMGYDVVYLLPARQEAPKVAP